MATEGRLRQLKADCGQQAAGQQGSGHEAASKDEHSKLGRATRNVRTKADLSITTLAT